MNNQPISQSVTLRSATRDDLPSLTALCREVQEMHVRGRPDLFADTDPHDIASYLASCFDGEGFSITVATRQEQVCGYVLVQDIHRPASPFRNAEHALYIHHIGVAKDTRRCGAGSALMNSVKTQATAAQCTAIRLDSWAFNTEAHDFFAHHGYAPMNIVFENRLTAP
ncbi:MAG TPA: GNAT family N-acetyltransferase [Candidatus Luteococcus avicola]|nr:GNAT family N-acetyltransferase [Candidatus Luteococcus avicola]